jgi:thiamine phosphate synthase YjbQ (UPF0047 family)
MTREALIQETIERLRKLPDQKIREVTDFTNFLINQLENRDINSGIKELLSESKSYEFLVNEDDLYSLNDLKERYR